MTTQSIKGFLLSRQWRDFSAGIEISYWASTERGPLRLKMPAQKAVCFIDRAQNFNATDDVQRKEVELNSTAGQPVDALYFNLQRDLKDADTNPNFTLHESDIKPADRYLMERFVTAGFEATGVVEDRSGYLEMVNPKLVPCDSGQKLKLASVDIETKGLTQQLYSIAVHSGDHHIVQMVGDLPDQIIPDDGSDPVVNSSEFELRFFRTEKELLIAFFDLLDQIDPDVIIGWNVVGFDLDFIAAKCRQLNLPLALGRGGEASAILKIGDGGVKIARVPGRAVLDGVEMLRAAFWSFESFSLENVGQELLGRGKTIQKNVDKVEEINRLYLNDKPALARYNINDCRLVTEIFAKADLINFAMQRAQMTGLPIDKTGGAVQTFDNLYLPLLHRKGYVAATIPTASGTGSPGGYVLDSRPGIYKNVIVLDFKSLYPSIIRTFLIDPLGLAVPGEQPVPGFEGATFSRHEHILPGLVEELWARRDLAKAQSNSALSQAIKIIMNSLYGVLGSSSCRFYNNQLASSITRRGHEIIINSQQVIEKKGWEVIYGDTDSLFVLLDESYSPSNANKVGEQLQADLNRHWQQHLSEKFNLQSHLEVEFETLYTRFVMPTVRGAQVVKGGAGALENTGSKKRYAGQVLNAKGDTELVFKGLEAVRTDWTPMAREFQRELYSRVFNDQPVDELIRTTTKQLFDGELDDKLVYRKRLRRKLSDYKRNVPPHVQAARKSSHPQRWIDYVLTVQGPEPSEERISEFDYQHYADKQLAPVADGILHFLNSSYHSVISNQIELF